MSRDVAIVLDIRQAAEFIGEFIRDMDHEAFVIDIKTQSAVLHQILVIGEAANRLSDSFCDQFSGVPWRD